VELPVFGSRHRKQVRRADASAVQTDVVKHLPLRERADDFSIHGSMGSFLTTAGNTTNPIPIRVDIPCP